MINETVLKILGLGVIGLGFLLALLAYRLLSKEQKKKDPRKIMLNSITVFMGFSIILCVVGLWSNFNQIPKKTYENKEQKVIKVQDLDKTQINVGVILNGNVHYTNAIFQGFRIELNKLEQETNYSFQVEYVIGSADKNDSIKNQQSFKELIERFDGNKVDYLIPIGTNVSEFAFQNYTETIPTIFIGVTDPIKSGFGTTYNADPNRKNISGVKYGLFPEDYLKFFEDIIPNTTLGLVYSESHPQDEYFVNNLLKAYQSGRYSFDLTTIKASSDSLNVVQLDSAEVFMGRYLVSTGLYEFLKEKNKPFLGSSKQNIHRGAVGIIGFEDIELGQLAVEILHMNLEKNIALKDIPFKVCERTQIILNTSAARKHNITITKKLKEKADILIVE